MELDVSNVKSLEALPAGAYPVLVEDVSLGVAKDSDEPLATFILVVFDSEHGGRRLWLRHTLSNKETASGFTPMSFFARTIAALTGEDITDTGEKWIFDESKYIGCQALAHVTQHEYAGEVRNDVNSLAPFVSDVEDEGDDPL